MREKDEEGNEEEEKGDLRIYVYFMHIGAHKGQKRVSELLKLTGITAIGNSLKWLLGSEPGCPVRAVSTLKCWTISLASKKYFEQNKYN